MRDKRSRVSIRFVFSDRLRAADTSSDSDSDSSGDIENELF